MRIAIFFALFGASMSGAQFYGVSFNKIVLIPFLLVLIFDFLFQNRDFKIKIKGTEKKILGIYILAILTCIYGIFSSYVGYFEYTSKIMAYAVQSVVFYIPIVLLLCSDKKKDKYYEYFIEALIWVCRIQGALALIQFIFFHLWSLDFNKILIEDILHGLINFEGGATRYSFEYGSLAIRITGLNNDPAYLCILLVMGYVFEKNKILRYVYVGIMILTLSRTGIITIAVLILWKMIKMAKYKKIHVKLKKIIMFMVSIVCVCIVFVYLYKTVPYITQQVDYFTFRLTNTFESTSVKTQSSIRHSLYIPYAIKAYFTELNIVQKFIGVGTRVTTIVFAGNYEMAEKLQFTGGLLNTAEATECDIAEMLLGTGIIGFWLYYSFLYKVFRNSDETVSLGALAIVIYGFMYDVSTITFVQILFWFMCINVDETIRKRKESKENIESLGEKQNYDVYNNA